MFAAAAICGCFLTSGLKLKLSLILAAVSFISIVLAILLKKHRARLFTAAIAIMLAASAIFESYIVISRKNDFLSEYYGSNVAFEGVVIEQTSDQSYMSEYVLQINKPIKAKAILYCEYESSTKAGSLISGTALSDSLSSYCSAENEKFYRSDGIIFLLTSSNNDLTVSENTSTPFSVKMKELNNTISNIITSNIGGNEGSLASSLLLGNRELLPSTVRRDFKRAGIMHILAISGTHLSVVVMMFEFIMRRLFVKKNARCLVNLLVATLYLSLTGMSLSTVRSFIMVCFVYGAYFIQSDNDLITSLSFALFVILAVSPNSVYDIGLFMSVLAVLGIIVSTYLMGFLRNYLYDKIPSKTTVKILMRIVSIVSLTVFSNAFLCFILWLYFGQISLITLISTCIVSPLCFIILSLTPLLVILSPIGPLASLASAITKGTASLIISVVSSLSSNTWATISLKYEFAKIIIIAMTLLLSALVLLPVKHKWLFPIVPAAAVIAFAVCLSIHCQRLENHTTVDFLSLGESEMMVISDTDTTILCDISTGYYSSTNAAYKQSLERYSTEISGYILTHYHTSHISTLARISGNTIVRRLYIPFPKTYDEYYLMRSILEVAERYNIDVTLFDSNNDIQITNNVFFNLSEKEYLKRSSHPAFSFTISSGNERLTYVSESVHETQSILLDTVERINSSEYVIFGKHGPVTKSDFSYEMQNADYVFIPDSDLLNHFQLYDSPEFKIVSSSSLVTIVME